MNPRLSYKNWIEHLKCLVPQQGVVYVGVGKGSALLSYISDSVQDVILVEAEESNSKTVGQSIHFKKNWRLLTATISSKVEDCIFYRLSNASENSLVVPNYLTSIWPNLITLEERTVTTTTLGDLLNINDINPEKINWLIIDCLPALSILQGAPNYNNAWDVISARVLTDDSFGVGQGASKIEVDEHLSLLGYRCVSVEEERQPEIARALYVRDSRYLQTQALMDLQVKNTQLTEQLTQVKAEQEKQIAEKAKAVSDLQGKNTQLTKQLTQVKSEQQKKIAEQNKSISDLQRQNAELMTRHILLQDEVVRAEAQIDLIKDVLLRESGL